MSGISTTRDVKSEIARAGYSVLRAADLLVSDELRQEWLSLSIDYADLPADEYLPGGARYRYRRYSRFRFSPQTGKLARLPHKDYFQSAEINRVTGGIIRRFAPLLATTFDNPFLRELIRFDFAQFPLEEAQRQRDWEVQAHLIRVTADVSERGQPTPEGIHRDGAAFVTVRLAELVNAQGGQVSLYDDDRRHLTTFRLEQALDSYLFNDAILWHAAEPVVPADPAHGAIRSILTFDYHPGIAGADSDFTD
ncbi:MAG: 2OG-Fe dioxygenase family protein [Chloroflexi bacterium]|nr:2OG-Fe dioxygenase family protein [Chloroflexota bacterium]